MPMRSDLPVPAMRLFDRDSEAEAGRSWFVETMNDSNFIAVLGFCVIGLLATLCLMYFFPELGAIVEPAQQF